MLALLDDGLVQSFVVLLVLALAIFGAIVEDKE